MPSSKYNIQYFCYDDKINQYMLASVGQYETDHIIENNLYISKAVRGHAITNILTFVMNLLVI